MCFTTDQLDRACGILLLTELNAFIYCCKRCPNEFATGTELETHILFEHDDDDGKKPLENIFVGDADAIYSSGPADVTKQLEYQTESSDMPFDESHIQTDEKVVKITSNEAFTNSIRVEPMQSEETEVPIGDESRIQQKTSGASSTTNRTASQSTVVATPPSAKKLFYCELCPGKSVCSLDSIRKHMKRHVEQRFRKCPICQKLPKNYEKHMQFQHTERPYKCDFCPSTFRTNNNRREHQNVHLNQKSFLCEECGKCFHTQSSQLKHKRQVHSVDRRIPCEQCTYTCVRSSQLRDHIARIHSSEKLFVCDVCNTSHSTKQYLQIHRLTHGEPTKKCRHCDKCFKTARTRRFHEKQVHKVFRMEQQYHTTIEKLPNANETSDKS